MEASISRRRVLALGCALPGTVAAAAVQTADRGFGSYRVRVASLEALERSAPVFRAVSRETGVSRGYHHSIEALPRFLASLQAVLARDVFFLANLTNLHSRDLVDWDGKSLSWVMTEAVRRATGKHIWLEVNGVLALAPVESQLTPKGWDLWKYDPDKYPRLKKKYSGVLASRTLYGFGCLMGRTWGADLCIMTSRGLARPYAAHEAEAPTDYPPGEIKPLWYQNRVGIAVENRPQREIMGLLGRLTHSPWRREDTTHLLDLGERVDSDFERERFRPTIDLVKFASSLTSDQISLAHGPGLLSSQLSDSQRRLLRSVWVGKGAERIRAGVRFKFYGEEEFLAYEIWDGTDFKPVGHFEFR